MDMIRATGDLLPQHTTHDVQCFTPSLPVTNRKKHFSELLPVPGPH